MASDQLVRVLPKDTELGYFVRLRDYISQAVGGSSIGKVWCTLGRSPESKPHSGDAKSGRISIIGDCRDRRRDLGRRICPWWTGAY
jgi:hypothetical protein